MYASQWEARMFGFWLVAGCKICNCLCLWGSSLTTSGAGTCHTLPIHHCTHWTWVFSVSDDLQNWVSFFRSNYWSSQGILRESRLLLNAKKFKITITIILWFFRRLFGVKNVATWSLLVVEATGDWKVGWVGSRFFCLAYKFSDSCVLSVEDVIQAWVWRV